MNIIKIRPHPQDTPTLHVFDGRGFVACLVGVALSNSGCGCRLVGACARQSFCHTYKRPSNDYVFLMDFSLLILFQILHTFSN